MYFNITKQEKFSRGELLLRTLVGAIYIGIPHGFMLAFYGIASQVLAFLAFWIILFTGSYPESFYEFQVKLIRWNLRVNGSLYNLIDGYPEFGLNGEHPLVQVVIPYPENLSRGKALLKFLLGWLYVGLPHLFVLYFRVLWTGVLYFVSFWVVLFTGEFPESMFEFQVGTLRWSTRLNLYLSFMTDKYPPFTGQLLPDEVEEAANRATSEDQTDTLSE